MATDTQPTIPRHCACGLVLIADLCPKCEFTPAECRCIVVSHAELAEAFWTSPAGALAKMGLPLDRCLPHFLADRGFAPQAPRYEAIRSAVLDARPPGCITCSAPGIGSCASCGRGPYCAEDLALHQHENVVTVLPDPADRMVAGIARESREGE